MQQEAFAFPTSFAQERMWILDKLDPDSPARNTPHLFRLAGALDIPALEDSLNEVVRRHEALRTTFSAVDGQPVQVIAPTLTLPLPVVDLTALPQREREARARLLAEQDAHQPFDLARGPLLRMSLLQLGPHDHLLVLVTHHTITDGWSMNIFFREISSLYRAFSQGQPSPLPDLPIQYADFAVWQQDWLQGDVLEAQLDYWRQQLDGAPPVLELPADHPRPAVQTYLGAHQELVLPAALNRALKALSEREGATLFMTLLAAYKVLLSRYTGQEDVVVGTPIAGRNRPELQGLIGLFVNSLVLRTDLSGDPTFLELLGRVREVALAAYDHQDMPFEKLVKDLQPKRDLSRTPLFQVFFNMHPADSTTLCLSGLETEQLAPSTVAAQFDLSLQVRQIGGDIELSLVYNTDLFAADRMQRMLGHYRTLLESIVAAPEARISDVPLLTGPEQHQLLVEWNETQADYAADLCVHQLFEAQEARSPNAVAIVLNDQKSTYRDLNARANQLAHHLRNRGVAAETVVGICIERSEEMVIGLLGILKAGGVYLPLDPAYPRERLAFMLSDTQAPLVLTKSHLLDKIPVHRSKVICLDTDWAAVAAESEQNPVSETTVDNLAYVLYTSGSTGQPKGVLIEHRSLSNYLVWVNETLLGGLAYNLPLISSLAFDACLKQLFAPLIRGGDVWILPENTVSEPLALLQALDSRGNVGLNCVPSLWEIILEEIESGRAAPPTESLCCLFLGGEHLNKRLLERTFAALPKLRIWNLYGPTETTANASWARLDTEGDVTIGRPIANTAIYLLDSHLQPVPIGVPGELCIGGIGVARGYFNRPELTSQSFIPNPFSDDPDSRLYRTGDLALFRTDGSIQFLGRIDDQIKLRGFRIELGEIAAVLGQHPDVLETVVLPREDGPDSQEMVAYVVPKDGQEPSASQLRSFLREKLPDYMVPAAFMMLDSVPRLPSGKVDRRALPVPQQARVDTDRPFTAPRDELEAQLVEIWEEVLDIRPIGVHDSFFQLGGHSLRAMRVMSRLRRALDLQLPERTIFETPTVAGLAAAVVQAQKSSAQPQAPGLVPLNREPRRVSVRSSSELEIR